MYYWHTFFSVEVEGAASVIFNVVFVEGLPISMMQTAEQKTDLEEKLK